MLHKCNVYVIIIIICIIVVIIFQTNQDEKTTTHITLLAYDWVWAKDICS